MIDSNAELLLSINLCFFFYFLIVQDPSAARRHVFSDERNVDDWIVLLCTKNVCLPASLRRRPILRYEVIKNAHPPEPFRDPNFWTHTTWLQLGYGLWVNLSVVGTGLALGFPAVTMPQLLDPSSHFDLSLRDQAWIASVLTLISPLGCLIGGCLQDRYGRRYMLIVSQLPVFIGWIYTGMASTVTSIIFGRIITGFGMGLSISAPRTYITEITLPNMRGVIGAFPSTSIALGILIQSTFGSFLKWPTLCYICGAFSIILLFTYILIPESPYYVLMKMSGEETKNVLKKFRSRNFDIDTEVEELIEFKEINNIRRLKMREQITEIFKISSCKPFCIGMFYFTLMQIVGVNVITMWGVEILKASKSSVNPKFGNIILSTTRAVAGVVTSILLFKVKRRVLALTSGIGVGVAMVTLFLWLFFKNEKSICPLILFIAYMIFAALGYYALPPLYMYELLPLKIRGILGGVGLAYVNILMFAVNWCYPYLRETIGFDAVMLIFGVISVLGSIVLYFILPETKDMTLQEIEEYFNSIRPTLVSSRQYILAAHAGPSGTNGETKAASYENQKKQFRSKRVRYKKDPPSRQPSFRTKAEDDSEKDSDQNNEKGIEMNERK